MKRGGKLSRRTPMKQTQMKRTPMAPARAEIPRTPMKTRPKSAAVQAAKFKRVYGSEDRAEWVRGQPCVACGKSPCHNAHVKTGGTSRKADAKWTVPLCTPCHDECHHGQQSFEVKYKIDLGFQAQIVDARWEAVTLRGRIKPIATPTAEPSSSFTATEDTEC